MMKHFYYILVLAVALIFGSSELSAQSVGSLSSKAEITSVNDNFIKVYPNPASSFFSFSLAQEKVGHITINNIIGKQIRRVEASSDGHYDVSDLRNGLYIIRIFDKKEELVKALRLNKV